MFLSPPPLPLYVSVCLSLYTSLSLSISTSSPLFVYLAHMCALFYYHRHSLVDQKSPHIQCDSTTHQNMLPHAGMLQYNVASGNTLQQWSLFGAFSQVCSPGLSHTLRILVFAQKQGTERLF